MKNKHQPVCCSVSSVCLILQDSGSLIFSLSSLINPVFDQISALPDALMLVFTSDLMGIFQHLLLNCSGRSFTDDEFQCGRSFTDDEFRCAFRVTGGASVARPPFWGENSNWTTLQINRNRQNNNEREVKVE